MRALRQYYVWALTGVAALLIAFVAGVKVGEYSEHQKFELLKDFNVVQADEYLAAGNYAKAIPVLHFSKAFEQLRGGSDLMLAKAYFGNDEPCLAQAFSDSHLRYMERNKLTSLSSYPSTQDLYVRASQACVSVLRPFPPAANGGK